jgi:hypothetical protein
MQIFKSTLRAPRLFQALVETSVKTPTAFYHEKVIDHYENPRNVGALNKSDEWVGTGLVGAPACGDVMKLQVTKKKRKIK